MSEDAGFYNEWHDPIAGRWPTLDDYSRALAIIHEREHAAVDTFVAVQPVVTGTVGTFRPYWRNAAATPPPERFWISYRGKGLRDEDGAPLLFPSVSQADLYVSCHYLRDATVYRLSQALGSTWTQKVLAIAK